MNASPAMSRTPKRSATRRVRRRKRLHDDRSAASAYGPRRTHAAKWGQPIGLGQTNSALTRGLLFGLQPASPKQPNKDNDCARRTDNVLVWTRQHRETGDKSECQRDGDLIAVARFCFAGHF